MRECPEQKSQMCTKSGGEIIYFVFTWLNIKVRRAAVFDNRRVWNSYKKE